MFNLEEDGPARRLAYLAAFVLFFVPLIQATSQLWPLQLGNIQWRYQAAGALSSVLMLPFLGLALGTLIARYTESTGMSRAIGIVAAIFAVGLAASLILFILDALQLKAIVQSRAMEQFQMASIRVSLITTLFTVLFAILAMTALRPPKGEATSARGKKVEEEDTGVGLLIGQEFAKAE